MFLLIYLVDISVSISPSGDNTAGDAYSLACSATVIGSIDTPNVAWLDAMNNTVPTGMVSVMGNVHTLTFNPLSASHAEVYTCRAALGGAVQTESMEVTVESECSIMLYCNVISRQALIFQTQRLQSVLLLM